MEHRDQQAKMGAYVSRHDCPAVDSVSDPRTFQLYLFDPRTANDSQATRPLRPRWHAHCTSTARSRPAVFLQGRRPVRSQL